MIRTGLRFFIALLLAALVWWVGPLLAIGVYHPFAGLLLRQVLVSLILLWGIWPFFRWLFSKLSMGGRRTEKPRRKKNAADPIDLRLRKLDRQLLARWLKQPRSKWSRFTGRITRTYRNELPWYLVLGAPGSGKSSLIAHAISQSRHTSGYGGQADDLDSNADFDYKLGDEAVWFDTSGQFSVHEELDENSWKQLLRKLRRKRKVPILNAVVICVDANALIQASPAEQKILGNALQSRLTALHDALGHPMQAYVSLTGLDKLDGAISMLALNNVDQWARGIGFALPDALPENDGNAIDAVWRQALVDLENRVQQQVLYSAPAAGDTATNQSQLRFVEAFGRLHAPLLNLLHMMIAPRDNETAARLRGVWLGSVAELIESPAHGSDPYSMRDIYAPRMLANLWSPLLRQIDMEKSGVLSSSGRTLRHRLGLLVTYALITGVATIALLWFGWGYLIERDRLEEIYARFDEGKRLAQIQAAKNAGDGSPLLAVAGQMRYAQAQVENTAEAIGTPYIEHSRVAKTATATYHKHLQKSLMPELYNEVRQALLEQTQSNTGDIYQTLKVYLMLSNPERRVSADVEQWINGQWEALSGGQYTEDDRKLLLSHVRMLMSLPDAPGMPADASLVQSARARASQAPVVMRVMQHIRRQGLAKNVEDVSLARAAGFGSAMVLRMRSDLPATDSAISGWYTRAGYEVFLSRLTESARATLEDDGWVLRDEPLKGNSFEIDAVVQKLSDATREQFLQDYTRNWSNFLNDITVRGFTGLDDASRLAAAMIDPASSLASVLRFASRETSLTGGTQSDLDSWIGRQKTKLERSRRSIVGELSGEHYRPTLMPEKKVEDQFERIHQIVSQMSRSTGGGENPLARLFEPVYQQLGLVNGALRAGQIEPEYDAFSRLRAEAARQPEPIRGVMLDLISNGSSTRLRQASVVLNQAATGITDPVCSQGMTNRYPFRRNAKEDVGVDDFERMFSAQGLMATHFREQLASYVDTSTTPWKARQLDSTAGPMVSADVLRAYENAARIRAATLDDSGGLRVSTVMRFTDMDTQLAEAELEIGGQSFKYAHGISVPQRVDWSSKNTNLAIRLQVKSIDGRVNSMQFDGPWALFRFFDAGRTAGGTAERRGTVHQSSLGSVSIEWQTMTIPSPIWSDLIQSFQCPNEYNSVRSEPESFTSNRG